MGNIEFSQMPWWVTVTGMVLSAIISFIATRLSSKDKLQASLVEQTVSRQQQLDKRQQKMMDDQQAEIGRLRDEILLIRKAQEHAQSKNVELTAKTLHMENEIADLRQENEALRKENTELKAQLLELKSKIDNTEPSSAPTN
jgi:uncharacterized coiled-coil DUF342 family protein